MSECWFGFIFASPDSLSFTSGLAVALAIVFLVITAGITVYKCFDGTIAMPRLLPDITDVNSIWKLFTVVPVLVTAYICHFNGMHINLVFHSKAESVWSLIIMVNLLLMTAPIVKIDDNGFFRITLINFLKDS